MPNVFMQSVIMLNVEASFEMNELIPEEIISFFGLSGFWTEAQNKESQIWLYSVCWGYDPWPIRPLGEKLQCGGLRPLYEGLERGGSSVEEGTACRSAFWLVFGGDEVDGCHYWWPCGLFLDFSLRRKILENHLPRGRNGNSEMIVLLTSVIGLDSPTSRRKEPSLGTQLVHLWPGTNVMKHFTAVI
jgi:hypothetical protein